MRASARVGGVDLQTLRRNLDMVIHEADHRLALPVIGSNVMRKPMGTDWWWRPMLWKGPMPVPGIASVAAKSLICEGTTIFTTAAAPN